MTNVIKNRRSNKASDAVNLPRSDSSDDLLETLKMAPLVRYNSNVGMSGNIANLGK
jgi:hypothetical protein